MISVKPAEPSYNPYTLPQGSDWDQMHDDKHDDQPDAESEEGIKLLCDTRLRAILGCWTFPLKRPMSRNFYESSKFLTHLGIG